MIQRHQRLRLAGVLCLALLVTPSAMAGTWYVDRSVSTPGDGSSWATAFQNISEAVAAATASIEGDEIQIASGTYQVFETLVAPLTFPDDIVVAGGYLDSERTTVFDLSDAPADNIEACIIIGSNTLLRHITFERSNRVALRAQFKNSIRLSGCSLRDNKMIALDFYSVTDLKVENCLLFGNSIGLVATGVDVSVEGCEFSNNGLSTASSGGGASLVVRNTSISKCLFESNFGSALGLVPREQVTVENCIFRMNVGRAGAAISYASDGSPYVLPDANLEINYDKLPVIRNCIFEKNSVLDGNGGAIYLDMMNVFGEGKRIDSVLSAEGLGCYREDVLDPRTYLPPVISSCVFYNNTAAGSGGAIYSENGSFSGSNLIFSGNSSPSVCLSGEDANVDKITYSLLQEVLPGYEADAEFLDTNLFALDPLFADAAAGDFRLLPNSPCIDSGRDASVARYGGVALDFDGLARGIDAVAGTQGDGSNYDMGVFEFVPDNEGSPEGEGTPDGEEPQPQSADQDADFIIALGELLRVIQFYNAGGLHCAETSGATEDGYLPGAGLNLSCDPHSTDFAPQNWSINLTELLRLIQFYNIGGYTPCETGEDGFCPGTV